MQQAGIDWRDGDIPVSRRFDDPYFSVEDGLAETLHVFLNGSGLPDRFRDGFAIGELGFGTGLNLLAVMRAWEKSGTPGSLTFTSFEAYPLTRAEARRAHGAFPALAAQSAALLAQWDALPLGAQVAPGIVARVVPGDARTTLPAWKGHVDAWFLDGFAPARNPELWEPALLAAVAARLCPGGTLATYSAAGDVRRALATAGMEVERCAGYGRKRHMTRARKAP